MACHGREIGPLGGYGAMLLDYNGGGFADLLLAMRRGQEKAQPGGAFGDGRIKDRLHVDAAGEQRLRELARLIELPVMTGTIAAPIEPPTSSPASRARSRNSVRAR